VFHTLTPWRLFSREKVIEIQDSDGLPTVSWEGFDDSRRSRKTHLANAAFIVTTCNAHDELVDACKDCMKAYNEGRVPNWHRLSNAVLRAEGKR
jgi:hypothetical protein